jgi:hypothetical protein
LTLRRSALPWLAPVGLTLIGFGVRVSGLDLQPLWGDEGWSYYFARMALPDMLSLTARDIHPPLYYALLSGWLGDHGRRAGGGTAVLGHRRDVARAGDASAGGQPLRPTSRRDRGRGDRHGAAGRCTIHRKCVCTAW